MAAPTVWDMGSYISTTESVFTHGPGPLAATTQGNKCRATHSVPPQTHCAGDTCAMWIERVAAVGKVRVHAHGFIFLIKNNILLTLGAHAQRGLQ